MAKKSGNATAAASRMLDPVTTEAALSILRKLIASAAADGRAFDQKEPDGDAVLGEADEPPSGMTALRPAPKSDEISEAQARALQPDIVLEEGQETKEELDRDGQRHITAPLYVGNDSDVQGDEALELLVDGLQTGRLTAILLDDIATVAIPAAYWAPAANRRIARQGYRLDPTGNVPGAKLVKRHIVVSEDDVHSLMGVAKPRNRGGRPP